VKIVIAIISQNDVLNQSVLFSKIFPMNSTDVFFMEEALIEAKVGFAQNEVPVGAVLVYRGEIIAKAHNEVEALQDPTAHAEILCLRRGAAVLDNWRMLNTILYCTLEPCAMCAGAMILGRVPQLVWGAPDLRHGACGSVFRVLEADHPIHSVKVRKGVLAEPCGQILKDFFKGRRNEKSL